MRVARSPSGRPADGDADRPLADLHDLGGRVAPFTGAAHGFGYATSSRRAEAGASALLTDRRAGAVEAAVGRLHAKTAGSRGRPATGPPQTRSTAYLNGSRIVLDRGYLLG